MSRVALRSDPTLAAPESAAVGQGVEFVEEHAAIPERLAVVVDVGRLPCVDGVAPVRGVQETVAGDGPGVVAVGAVEVGVAAIPLAALAEFERRGSPRR